MFYENAGHWVDFIDSYELMVFIIVFGAILLSLLIWNIFSQTSRAKKVIFKSKDTISIGKVLFLKERYRQYWCVILKPLTKGIIFQSAMVKEISCVTARLIKLKQKCFKSGRANS